MAAPLQDRLKQILEEAEKNVELKFVRGYVLDIEIKEGGMGAVYRIKHRATGGLAAIKVMRPSFAVTRKAAELFRREIQLASTLNHLNVVRVYGSGYAQGVLFLVMEYCEGGSVFDLMGERGGRLDFETAVDFTVQALAGLEYLHHASLERVELAGGSRTEAHGLVHRDLKPQNLLLVGRGGSSAVKVSDFGLSKAFDLAGWSGVTITGDAWGTPEFISREQLANYKYAEPKVDVWSAAACLYNMITGTYPRNFRAGGDKFLVVKQNSPIPIRQRMASVPSKLAELIDNALAEDGKPSPLRTASGLKLALQGYVKGDV